MRGSKYGLGLAITAACMAFGVSSASAAKVQVLPADINAPGGEWSLTLTGTGTGGFQTGPKLPPLGTGSFKFTTGDSSAKVELFTNRYKGTLLSDVDSIGYSTFRDPDASDPSSVVLPSLQLPIDRNGNVTTGGAFTTLVFEPYLAEGNSGVKTNVWQDWDASVAGSVAGGWYATGAGGTASGCTPAATCTLQQLQTDFPSAKLYAAGLNQGSGNAGGKGDADALYLGLSGQDQTTFDFEAEAGPTGPAGSNGTNGTNGTNGQDGNAGTNGSNGANGTNGAPGTSGTFTFAGTTVNTKAVTLSGGALKTSKKRQVKISVTCPRSDGLCEGSLKLYKGRTTLARQTFQVRGGRTSKVTLTIGRKAYKALAKSGSANLSVFSRDLAGAASTFAKKVTVKK